MTVAETWVAGVDGCRTGWLAVMRDPNGSRLPRLEVFANFSEILSSTIIPAIIAVDMPIGLPDRTEGPGRVAEQAVRPLLGARQSSVFSIPARAAVMCETYRQACRQAQLLSDPPRKVSRQAFNIFAKIREIDALMTPELNGRIYEVHPEVGFWRLNGERPMSLPKKVRSSPNAPGLDERRTLLQGLGYEPGFLAQAPPRGAGPDDLVDAAVCAVIAERIYRGEARPMPDPPGRDGRGLEVAIWS